MAIRSTGPTPVNIRLVCFALACLTVLMVTFSLAAPYWRVTARWGTAAVIVNIFAFEGIFLSCIQTMGTAGTSQCFQIPSYGGMGTYPGNGNMIAYTRGVYGE